MSRRRRLLLALMASPVALARAQPAGSPTKIVRVGILNSGMSTGPQTGIRHFVEAMRELGWIEGRNIVYDRVFSEGDSKRLPDLAVSLVSKRPDLIYVSTTGESVAALNATRTIPVVFASPNEPIEAGIIKSFARSGGNATGVAVLGPETGAKRLQLLRETLPKVRRVGLLMIEQANARERQLIEEAAGAELKVIPAMLKGPQDLEAAFAFFKENRVEAVMTAQVGYLVNERQRVVDLAMKQRLPVVGHRSEHADVGALLSYNSSLLEQRRRAAQIADKILRGAKPADIPVELPTKFELVINLKTAKALGIAVPQSVLLQASRVIE